MPLDFEILSKLMRYVFTFLSAVIVWRSFTWLRKDRRATHKRLRALPDAGTIGVLTVLRGSAELQEGTLIPVPHEGVLGFLRTCDVVVPVTDVVSQHLDFTFRNGKGLYIYPRRGCPAAVDGVLLESPADSRRYPMQHGSVLEVGDALLQLGVFAGLKVGHVVGAYEEAPPEPPEAPPMYMPPQQMPPTPPPPCEAPGQPYGIPVQPAWQPQVNLPWQPPSFPEGRDGDEG